jgi:phosphoheptose isomerase
MSSASCQERTHWQQDTKTETAQKLHKKKITAATWQTISILKSGDKVVKLGSSGTPRQLAQTIY